MEGRTVLVVDDEPRMRKLIRDFLSVGGFCVLEARDGEEALEVFFGGARINLIILDIMMPRLDGWGVCREIRKASEVPVIMLTAKDDEQDELLGFSLGVDEYIAKPFSPKILVARVEALLRRVTPRANAVSDYGGILVDKAGRSVRIGGEAVALTSKEYELLLYLIENQGIALSRDKILNNVWAYDYFGDTRTVDTHIKKLRGKLSDKSAYVKTVWGMGYKFEVAP